MPVDTSFYPQLQPQQQMNPLQMMSTVQGIQHQQMQNQLLQRTMAAQQAIGSAAQHSMRPDGTRDLAQYQQEVQASPDAAFGGTDAANDAQSNATAQAALVTQQIANAQSRLNILHQQAGALADDPDLSIDKVTGVVGDLTKMGVLDAPHAADILAALPKDPSQLKGAMLDFQKQAMDTASQISEYHQQHLLNTGGAVTSVNPAPLAPTVATTPMTLTPGEAASPVTGPVNADGSPTTTTLGQRAGMGTITTGQTPAAAAAQTTSGGLAAQGEAAFSHNRQQATQNAANFSLLRGDLGKMFTGSGAEQRSALARIAQTVGIKVDADKITSTESAAKVLQQIINAQPNAGSSDKQLMASITANPHLGLSKDGLTLMSAVAEGNNNAMLLAGKAWDKAKSRGVGSEQFNDRMPAIVSKLDPKVFQYEAAPPALRHFITDGMNQAQLQQFHATLSEGLSKGWFK